MYPILVAKCNAYTLVGITFISHPHR